MNSYRKVAVVVGILFIIATAAPMLSYPFLQHLQAPDFLAEIPAHITPITTGAILELIMALAIVGIATTIYPILRRQNEYLALGYVGARIIESVVFIVVAVMSLLSLITVSHEFANAGFPESFSCEILGNYLRTSHDWAYVVAGKIVFPISALILNLLLYQSKLVPRFISVWGLLGSALLLAAGLAGMFSLLAEKSLLETLLFLPIALQEMVFAVWLIVKGFNASTIATGSA